MIFSQIWERYLLREALKVFFLFLICFYGLYVLIDYASHANALSHQHGGNQWLELARRYFFIFVSQAEILIPFALLISVIKTLCSLNSTYELVALMAGGFKLRALLRPFIFLGLLGTALLFLNEQFTLPSALKKLRYIDDKTKHQTHRNKLALAVQHLILEDGSLLLFQSYDTARERFFDAYWIQSTDRFYRIKYLYPSQNISKGLFVDFFKRESNNELTLQESFKAFDFTTIRFNAKILQSALIEPDALSLSELWAQLPRQAGDLNEKETKLLTAFYWKLTIPWLCLLVIVAPIPFCLKHSRSLPVFFIYVCGVFGFIAFYLIMDALQVVLKRQVLDPFWALVVPFTLVFSYLCWRSFD